MVSMSNILCKAVGVTGLGLVMYDSYAVGKAKSKKLQQQVSADYFEKIHASSRTTSTISPINSAMQEKVASLRYNNPIVPTYGKIKGFFQGSLSSLGNNIFPVAFSALAIAGKGFIAKAGAVGVAACGLVDLLREGFGIGKPKLM